MLGLGGFLLVVLILVRPESIRLVGFDKPDFSQCGFAGAGSCYPPLTSRMWWEPEKTEPFAGILAAIRKKMPDIKKDLTAFNATFNHEVVKHKNSNKGGWMTTSVWTATEGWRENSCLGLPTLCRILPNFLPTTEKLMLESDQEEFEIFGMAPLGHLKKHHDGSGPRLGMLICIIGCDGSAWHRMYHPDQKSYEDRFFAEEGQAIVFDPNYKHEAGNNSPDHERWVISIQLSHPEYTEKFDQLCHGCHPYSVLHQNALWSLENSKTELIPHPKGKLFPAPCSSWWRTGAFDYCHYCQKEGQTSCDVSARDRALAAEPY